MNFTLWAIIPLGEGLTIFDYSLGILYTLALSSLGVIWKLIYTLIAVFNNFNLQNIKNNKCKLNTHNSLKNLFNKNMIFINQTKRYYSSNNKVHIKNLSQEEFANWLSGFCDAGSNFFISDLQNRFSFFFNIKLHIDDIKVLQIILEKIEAGKIYKHKNTATFRLSKF